MEEATPVRTVDTQMYIQTMLPLLAEGKTVTLPVTGSSMAPFLVHQRDMLLLQQLSGPIHRGDMVLFQRETGQYVMHRVRTVHRDRDTGDTVCYLIGDGQTETEGPISQARILAAVPSVRRKGKWIGAGDLWWEFFRRVWLRIIPLRPAVLRIYEALCGKKQG